MAKRLALFSDGTGNSSAKAEKTNVWRLFQALDQTTPEQLAHYDDGVGTSSNKYLAALGGAFGWGLKRNVVDLYKFVCRNYQPGDRIHAFGFSRGSFTIRMLMGLIADQGLVQCDGEEALDRAARAAFRDYRWNRHWKAHHLLYLPRKLVQALSQWRGRAYAQLDDPRIRDVPIEFLGLFDTVAAYQMPVDEIKRAIDYWLMPLSFPDHELSPTIARACHALALDEQRQTFHPALWDEDAELRMVREGKVAPGRLRQVWFPGVHSNVGGGYPEDRLSLVPLGWIAEHAAGRGLVFDPLALQRLSSARSPYARLYDSRAGAGVFYRYAPRRMNRVPVIHGSVVMKIVYGDGYAPVTLPERFEILAPNNAVVLPSQASSLAASPIPEVAALGNALGALAQARTEELERILDTVWWRRAWYFVMLALAVVLALYPLFAGIAARLLGLERSDLVVGAIIAPGVEGLSGLVPEQLGFWVDAMRAHPLGFGALALLFALSLYQGHFLRVRIEDRASHAWRVQRVDRTAATAAVRERNSAAILLLVALCSTAAFVATVMREPGALPAVVWGAVSIALWGFAYARYHAHVRMAQVAAAPGRDGGSAQASAWLRFARHCRTSRGTPAYADKLANVVFPGVFLALIGAGVATVTNKALVQAVTAIDAGCREARGAGSTAAQPAVFRTSDRCWASGVRLAKGARYRITMTMGEDWFDGNERADMRGVASNTARHMVLAGLKRWWSGNWLQPVARIGEMGNDEYLLEPRTPYADGEDNRKLVAEITARESGELFLYANDTAIAFSDNAWFRRNNRGTALVSIERLRD
jgi:uncharacterized protein (DUF2235 family)